MDTKVTNHTPATTHRQAIDDAGGGPLDELTRLLGDVEKALPHEITPEFVERLPESCKKTFDRIMKYMQSTAVQPNQGAPAGTMSTRRETLNSVPAVPDGTRIVARDVANMLGLSDWAIAYHRREKVRQGPPFYKIGPSKHARVFYIKEEVIAWMKLYRR